MRVVSSESCPIPSLMTESGMFLLLAMLAQQCLAQCMVSGMFNSAKRATSFRATLIRLMALRYCVRSSAHGLVIIGSRYWAVEQPSYLAMISSMHFSHLILSCCPVFLLRYMMTLFFKSDFFK